MITFLKPLFNDRTLKIIINPFNLFKAVGFQNGHLQLVDSISLEDCLKAPFTYSKESITHIEFSRNAEFLATAVSFIYY